MLDLFFFNVSPLNQQQKFVGDRLIILSHVNIFIVNVLFLVFLLEENYVLIWAIIVWAFILYHHLGGFAGRIAFVELDRWLAAWRFTCLLF